MNAAPRASAQLNYFQQSPVRGQLEVPADAYGKAGWRYLQCTDTPNEIRVLLPPRTSALYGQLLRAELAELAKDRQASWDALVQIRHLKDRMIRKCQRIVRDAVPREPAGVRVLFHSAHAPPDFRLKEMERWLRMQGVDIARAGPSPPGASPPPVQIQAAQAAAGSSSIRRVPSQGHRPPAMAGRPVQRPPGAPGPTGAYRPGRSPSPQKRAVGKMPQRSSSRAPTPNNPARPRSGDLKQRAAAPPSRPNVRSPEPLPIPFRTHGSGSGSPSSGAHSPASGAGSPKPIVAPVLTDEPQQEPRSQGGSPLPTIPEDPAAPAQRPLVRRRSSLKKQGSVGSLSKSVAWAMDRDWVDQMDLYVAATNEAEALSVELAEIRAEHHEGMKVMRGLCQDVNAASERVRQELEGLKFREDAVRQQEAKLMQTSERMEEKEIQLQDKVLAVLEEAKRVVQLCDKKRETHEA